MLSFVEYSLVFLDKSWDWLNDAETKHLTMTPDFTKESQLIFFHSLPSRKDYFIRGVLLNEEPIGACGLKKITNVDAEYWGYIGEKKYWGSGYGKTIMDFLIEVSKEKGLTSLYLHVLDSNERAKSLYEKKGFSIESKDGDILKMRLAL